MFVMFRLVQSMFTNSEHAKTSKTAIFFLIMFDLKVSC